MQAQFISSHFVKTNTHHVLSALSAMSIGLALVLLVGFAPIAEVHNAAHDTRHTAAFPCH